MRRPFRRGSGETTHDDGFDEWAESEGVIIFDTDAGLAWVRGNLTSDEYLADAISSAREEAREEVQELLDA